MAFWGIEVILGNPVTHYFDKVRRRLRISQVTLGIGSAIKKSLVQYNVGNKSPVFLCALLSDKTELCHLDLDFEEADDVVFSVIGPRSVYLPGYYVSNDPRLDLNSDTESYGEDIANRETDESGHHGNEDDYEDCFIDDDDEEMLDKEMIREREGCKRIKWKKLQIIDSDDLSTSQENEDDDNQLLYVFKSKKAAKHKVSRVGENACQVTVERSDNKADCGTSGHVLKGKGDAITNKELKRNLDGDSNSSLLHPADSENGPNSNKKMKHGGINYCRRLFEAKCTRGCRNDRDLSVITVEDKKPAAKDTNLDCVADGYQLEKPRRKIEEDKSQENKENSKTSESLLSANVTRNPSISRQVRNLSNGLVIEELALCDQDGKIAALGKKVKVYYTAMLKESGRTKQSRSPHPLLREKTKH